MSGESARPLSVTAAGDEPRKASKAERKASRKRATTEAALDATAEAAQAQQHCTFPPVNLSDFVIHYRNTSYHVHKFVLQYHSAYFRTYIEQLTPGQRAYSLDECDQHGATPYCIRIPSTVVQDSASEEHFRVFLCQLYFARHYSSFPLQTALGVDVHAQPELEQSLDCPPHTSFEQMMAACISPADRSELRRRGELLYFHPALSLCDYFDCARVLSRAEDNLLLFCTRSTSMGVRCDEATEWTTLSMGFELAVSFHLKRVKEVCIPLIVEHCILHGRRKDELDALRRKVNRDTAFAMMQAAIDVAARLVKG